MKRHTPFAPIPPLGGSNDNLTLDDLPPPDTKRWVTNRKAMVVNAVRSGLISLEEACRRYSLSIEEFVSWQTLLDQHGVAALRVTRLNQFRRSR
ncbi:MAG: DUF1153 domain-containing protein [Alphaproteobacteria bacterium]|nr:DUF1153 domain-containing protein [Alphaproteobacteria bacterium]MBF0249257.1 DUF1153 domain-containing protein [Alphaproteobacteria bacterium]